MKVNQTGKSGDGKNLRDAVSGAISVRTGEGGDSVSTKAEESAT